MPDRYRSHDDPLGRFALLIGSLVVAGMLFGFLGFSNSLVSDRERLRAETEQACGQTHQQACHGNMADIRAAAAADHAVNVGIWQTATGIVGLVLIGWTLSATRAAVREANEATEAARSAVAVTEDGSRRQLRAYVVAAPGMLTGLDSRDPLKMSVSYKNTGQTPAYNVSVELRAVYAPNDEAIAISIPDDEDVARCEMTLGNGESFAATHEANFTPLPVACAEIRRRRASIMVFGLILYEDIYGVPHKTRFMHRFTDHPLKGSLYDSYNHAD